MKEFIRIKYLEGKWTKEQVLKAVDKGWITENEAYGIIKEG